MTTSARRATEAESPQDLAHAPLGRALLRAEQAHRGLVPWQEVHAAFAACTRQPLLTGPEASLYFGAPAVAFALNAAAADSHRFARTREVLHAKVVAVAERRIALAHRRIDRAQRPRPSEYDLFYGLTGLGAYFLHCDPSSRTLREIVAYLVRLVRPLEGLPGWWTPLSPSGTVSTDFPAGHANAGMAHGIAGPLSLLALCLRHGITVDGQHDALREICAWLDRHRRDGRAGAWWPPWTTIDQHQNNGPSAAPRPSWCYGTPGIARAQQLAGIALGDVDRQQLAEQALIDCLTDPEQLQQVTDPGLCHGAAGVLLATQHVAGDAAPGRFTNHLEPVRRLLHELPPAGHDGLLDGSSGTALARLADENGGTVTDWHSCLLVG
ncbi:lanthionine synthetase C family protein [Saccharopolyspora sp. CA-218241]|uniref:lanthionine synthetase C family protein n=1 Tax=Saccharopolyspora sp. CA-218241 TaxID=3240027 RepID=UPI003D96A9D3